MKLRHLVIIGLALATCADVASIAAPRFKAPSSPTMPPRRVADCVTYVLLDNKCTADWYACGEDRTRCVRAWDECCTLPGNPARTTIVRPPQTP
jgi:hypothetical protein